MEIARASTPLTLNNSIPGKYPLGPVVTEIPKQIPKNATIPPRTQTLENTRE
jgi:hypothetical protein